MLGRLARWLRLIGCDVLYGQNFSGKGLVEEARRSRRLILTRDSRLVRDPDVPPYLFIEADRVGAQLAQVVGELRLDPRAHLFGRCAECNGELELAAPSAVADEVPPFVLETQRDFRRCRGCRHVYWQGTHVARVEQELERFGLGARTSEGPS